MWRAELCAVCRETTGMCAVLSSQRNPMELSTKLANASILESLESLLMPKKKCIRARRPQDRLCLPLRISGNPLWPLEELRNLRNPPVVADPEFTPLAIDALGCRAKDAFALAPEYIRQVETDLKATFHGFKSRPANERHIYVCRKPPHT
jgi:hypothetical protein